MNLRRLRMYINLLEQSLCTKTVVVGCHSRNPFLSGRLALHTDAPVDIMLIGKETSFPPPPGSDYSIASTVHEFSCSPLNQFYVPFRTYKQIDNEDLLIKYAPRT